MGRKPCTDANPSVAPDFMKVETCVSLTALINASTVAALLQTPVSVSLAGVGPTVAVLVTVITGDLTAAAGVSAKTELCVTPSPELVTAPRATGDGAVRTVVNRAPMVTTVIKGASVRMERPVTTSLGNVVVHLDTLEPSVRICVLLANMAHSVSRDVPAKMEACAIMSLESAPALLAGWAQCVVSPAPRVALERTVPKNVSATMEERVMLPQANVTAAQDTQGNGARMNVLLGPTEFAVLRPAGVLTEGSVTM